MQIFPPKTSICLRKLLKVLPGMDTVALSMNPLLNNSILLFNSIFN